MKKNPCRDCENRSVNCHAECDLYLDWVKENRKQRDLRKRNNRKYSDYFYHD